MRLRLTIAVLVVLAIVGAVVWFGTQQESLSSSSSLATIDAGFAASPSPEPTAEPSPSPIYDENGNELPPLPMTGAGSDVASADINAYTSKCLQATTDFSLASISFDPAPSMMLEQSSQYVLSISESATKLPPPLDTGVEEQGQLKVTCTIGAQLVMADSDATVDPADWQQQTYVPPDPSVWVWEVTPHQSGTMKAAILVRPVIKVEGEDGSTYDGQYKTATYPVTISVGMTLIDRITSFTQQANVILAALTVIVGIGTILGVKRWRTILAGRRTRAGEQQGVPTPVPVGAAVAAPVDALAEPTPTPVEPDPPPVEPTPTDVEPALPESGAAPVENQHGGDKHGGEKHGSDHHHGGDKHGGDHHHGEKHDGGKHHDEEGLST